MRCPYTVLERLVNNATLKGSKDGHLAFSEGGTGATKSEIVGDWRKLYGKAVSGHSTRRSGALQYIRKGWAVSQVGYLGRWKSNVILEYAQEALESLAVNASNHFKGNPTEAKAVTKAPSLADMLALGKQLVGKVDKELVNRLQTEVDALRQDSEGANSALSERKEHGGQDGHIRKVPATSSPISDAPGGSQEQQNIGIFTICNLEDSVRMVLLLGQLPVRRRGPIYDHLCEVPGVCA